MSKMKAELKLNFQFRGKISKLSSLKIFFHLSQYFYTKNIDSMVSS